MDFIFKLTEEDANIIIAGLGELQAKVAMPIISKLQKQAKEQGEASGNNEPTESRLTAK